MSIEAALAENTAAQHATKASLDTVAELLKQSMAGRDAALATLTAKTAGDAAAAAPTEEKKRGRPPGSGAKAKEAAAPKALTVDDLRKAAGDFMDTTDTAEREKRKEFVKAMIDHFGVSKVVDIADESRQQAVDWLAAKGRGEAVSFNGAEDEAPEEDDMLG